MFDMKRREFITVLGGMAATWPLAARAQLLGVGPREKATSTRVAVAVGDLMNGTTLLIANVNTGADTSVEVIIGNISAGGRRIVNDVGAARIWAVPLEPRDANSHVVVRSIGGVPILVQLAVDDGKVDEATVFPS
jgi:hypothetical protein